MRNYFGYIRVSTVKQGEHGVSLQEQRDAIARYSQSNQLEITEWFEERLTAAKSGRPVFNEMLRGLRQGKAAGVVIHKIDRSARNLKDWANLGELLDQGIDVKFANENVDLNSRGGRLSADIQAVVAADYIRNLREETRKGFYGRLKQGIYPLPAPLGYLDNGAGQPKTLCPIIGPLVRQAFELYATGNYSLDNLVDELYRRGLRNKAGKPVTRNGLSVILNNPFYLGLIRLRRTDESFAGAHQPLVNKALFERVQSILTGRAPKRVKRHAFVFRQLFVCRGCGRHLIGEQKKGHVYYRCHTKTCRLTCIREETIAQTVEQALQPLVFSGKERALLWDVALQLRRDWRDEQQRQLAILKMRHTAVTQRIARLTDAFLDNVIEKALFEERKKALLVERLSIDDEIRILESSENTVSTRLTDFLELAGSAQLSYKSGTDWHRRELLRIVMSNRTVAGKNVAVELFPPFQEVAKRPKSTNGGPCRDTARTFLTRLSKILTKTRIASFNASRNERSPEENAV